MDIWVRSQTRKNLIKVKGFIIDENRIENKVIIEDADTYAILGVYSLDRAITILNDIEGRMFELKEKIYYMPLE